jgi:hypothetical protein
VERELELTVALQGPHAAASPPKRMRRGNPAQLELFSLPSPQNPAPPTEEAPGLVVKATLDLLVELNDGSLHVIDYKRSAGGDVSRYAPQLSLYRSVVERQFGKTPRVGLLHLLGDEDEPEWLSPTAIDPGAVARAFLAARANDRWPGTDSAKCRAVRCGFVGSCHSSESGAIELTP